MFKMHNMKIAQKVMRYIIQQTEKKKSLVFISTHMEFFLENYRHEAVVLLNGKIHSNRIDDYLKDRI